MNTSEEKTQNVEKAVLKPICSCCEENGPQTRCEWCGKPICEECIRKVTDNLWVCIDCFEVNFS